MEAVAAIGCCFFVKKYSIWLGLLKMAMRLLPRTSMSSHPSQPWRRLNSQASASIEPQSESTAFVDAASSHFDYFYDEPGSMPGTLKIESDAPPPIIVLIDYSEAKATKVQLAAPEDCEPYLDTESVSWVDVKG